ncbi:MAG: hypothetical protein ABWZ25_17635 [Chitinophagaceae bacterium]
MKINLHKIFPLIVPSSYYVRGTWDLPHFPFLEAEFILTWITFDEGSSMLYLTREQYQNLEVNNAGWQQNAFENLRLSINDEENFFSQYKKNSDGRLLFLAFINSDGIGSSRIMFAKELTKAFPHGYYIAFPDRSCGLVIGNDIRPDELTDIKKTVEKMFKEATTAMSNKLFSPESFKLPIEWVTPINPELSDLLAEEIIKL